jgi:hypothetical protein
MKSWTEMSRCPDGGGVRELAREALFPAGSGACYPGSVTSLLAFRLVVMLLSVAVLVPGLLGGDLRRMAVPMGLLGLMLWGGRGMLLGLIVATLFSSQVRRSRERRRLNLARRTERRRALA